MTYTSIFEKILFILNIVSTSWIYMLFILASIILILLLGLKKISKKFCFVLITLITLVMLGYTIFVYYAPISKMVNSIVDNLFLNIYFPSAYTYLFVLVLINVFTLGNLLKPRGEKVYKTINGICFILTNFTLTLILELIAKDNVDVFSKESLFTNTGLITLLEFGINIFVVWIISLIAIYFINNITERIIISRENKKLLNEPAVTINSELVVDSPMLQEECQVTSISDKSIIENPVQAIMSESFQNKFIPTFTIKTIDVEEKTQNKFIPTLGMNISEKLTDEYNYSYDNNSFDLSSFIPKKQVVSPISIVNNNENNQIFEQILNNELPYIKEEVKPILSIEETKKTYTLNDYRIFNKMLKDIREHNQSNSVVIDKNLEYRLITKYSTETYDMFKTMLKIYSN